MRRNQLLEYLKFNIIKETEEEIVYSFEKLDNVNKTTQTITVVSDLSSARWEQENNHEKSVKGVVNVIELVNEFFEGVEY